MDSDELTPDGERNVCCLCLSISTQTLLPAESGDIHLLLTSILPDVNLRLSKNPGVCSECHQNLWKFHNFRTLCMENQSKILQVYTMAEEPVNLLHMLQMDNKLDGNFIVKEEPGIFDNNIVDISLSDIKSDLSDDPEEENIDMTLIEIVKIENILNQSRDEDITSSSSDKEDIEINDEINNVSEFLKSNHPVETDEKVPNNEPYLQNQIYSCKYCKYMSMDSSEIDSHLKHKHNQYEEENSKTSILCTHCSYSTHRESLLKAHLRFNHSAATFSCSFCNLSFITKVQLEAHYLKYHITNIEGQLDTFITSKIYSCDQCKYKSLQRFHFKKHLNMHNQNKKRKINNS